MKLSTFFKERIARLSMLDIKLSQGAAMCVMALLIKVYPEILRVNIWWFLVVAVILETKPLYVFYLKRVDG